MGHFATGMRLSPPGAWRLKFTRWEVGPGAAEDVRMLDLAPPIVSLLGRSLSRIEKSGIKSGGLKENRKAGSV